jgi:hypothetical protein
VSQMGTQAGMTLARVCGSPRWNYVQRTSLPEHTCAATKEFNQLKREAVSKLLNERIDEETFAQRELPIAMGGNGLRALPEISEFAFFASRALTACKRAELHIAPSAEANAQLQTTLRKIWQTLEQRPRDKLTSLRAQLPQCGADFDEHFKQNPSLAHKLQHQLTALLVEEPAKARLELRSPEHKVRMRTASSPHASDWMKVSLADPQCRMRNEEAIIAYKLSVGSQPKPSMPLVCGPCKLAIGPSGSHQLSCKHTAQKAMIARHDDIAKCIHQAVNSLPNANCFLELSGLSSKDRRRIELEMWLGMARKMVDVQVINTLTPSRLLAPAKAIPTAEAAKLSKYADVAKEHEAELVPFIMTALGEFGPKALKFLDALEEYATSVDPELSQVFRRQLTSRISVINARAAARIVHFSVQNQQFAARRLLA